MPATIPECSKLRPSHLISKASLLRHLFFMIDITFTLKGSILVPCATV